MPVDLWVSALSAGDPRGRETGRSVARLALTGLRQGDLRKQLAHPLPPGRKGQRQGLRKDFSEAGRPPIPCLAWLISGDQSGPWAAWPTRKSR